MQISKSQLVKIVQNLPNFDTYPLDECKFVIVEGVSIIASKSQVLPDSKIPIMELRFVKNHEFKEWCLVYE